MEKSVKKKNKIEKKVNKAKKQINKEIYLDYAATTPMREEVLAEALPYFSEKFGNPGSFHSKGLEAKKAMNNARERIAKVLGCLPEEIIFTGSGTESINLAIKGLAIKALMQEKRGTFITQKTEHHATIETLTWAKKEGFEVIELSVDEEGIVDPAELEQILQAQEKQNEKVLLVTIMYANNEIGTIQPIKKIAEICHKHNVLFHTDACQGAEYLPIDVEELGVDMLTLNGSKLYAFKGTGALYKRKDIEIEPLIHGGGHERGMRGGTENVPGIVALAKALEIAEKEKKKESARLKKLQNYFIKKVEKEIPRVLLNGARKERLVNNVNFSFEGVEGESILLRLNEKGIFVSTGSACSSQTLEPSHVLLGIGLPHGLAHGSIRFTFGKGTTKQQLTYTIKELKEIIKFLRSISPEWKNEKSWRMRK